jgi:hypothetical protein
MTNTKIMVRCFVLPCGLVLDDQRAGHHITEVRNYGNIRISGLLMISTFVTLVFSFLGWSFRVNSTKVWAIIFSHFHSKQSWILLPKALKNRYESQMTEMSVVDQSLGYS